MCQSVFVFTFSNMNISATSGPIKTKFYLKHHLDEGKALLGSGPDRIGTLVSMATDSSHSVIMRETVFFSRLLFHRIFYTFRLRGNTCKLGGVRSLARSDHRLRR